ncbi:hypothetical protein Tco_0594127 [Tanacetum coccineum]
MLISRSARELAEIQKKMLWMLSRKLEKSLWVGSLLLRKQEDQQETAGTGGSSEGTGTIPGVPNESTVVSATSNEGTGTKPGVPDKKKVITEEKVILEWGSEQESEYSEEDQLDDKEKYDKEGDGDDEGDDHISDTQDTNDEDDETESDGDEIYKYKIRVRKDEDVEMTNAEVEDFKKGNEEISNVAQADVKKTEEIKDTAKKAELPPTRSSLSVSLGFGDQFLKLSSNNSLVSIVKDNTDADINSLLELRVAKLKKDVSELKKIDHSAKALATLKSQVSTVVKHYLGSKIGDDLQKVLQRHTTYLIQKYSLKPTPESSKIQKPKIDLEQEYEKSASEIRKIKREQAEKQKMSKYTIKSTDKATLKEMKNAMDKGVADTVKNYKRQHDDDDENPSAGPNQSKKTKRRRTKEPESSKKPTTAKDAIVQKV